LRPPDDNGQQSQGEHHDDHGRGGNQDDHGRHDTHIAIVANHWVLTDGHTTTQIAGNSVTLDGQTYLLVDHFGGGFQAVQAAIDAAHGDETVLIAPGTYTESKTPAPFSGTAGGLFINTAGLTLQGVKSDGSLITTAADAKAFGATIISGSETDFGSNHFIGTGGNGTTIQGLHLEAGDNTTNKLVEVWGDHVTIENNFIDVNNTSGYTGAAAIYLDDPIAGPVSSVNNYLIAGNELNDGIYVANGVGTAGSGISSDQRIVNNHFDGTFDSHTGIGTYDMVAVQGLIPGRGWQTESAQVPTISGNSSDGSVPFLFRMTDAILADFPTAAQLATLVDHNTGPDDSYAYLLTAGGQLQTHQSDTGSGPFYRFYVANSIDTLNLGVDSTPDKVYGGQRIDMLAGDKLIVQSGDGTVNSDIVANGLTVIASKESDDLNLTLADKLPDGTPVKVQSITLGDYSTGHGANVDVIGNALNNVIVGNSGDNVITGGGGADVLTGGGGHDTFKFVAVTDSAPGATHYDTITDFQHGVDKIDLSAIDANTLVAGDQAFGFTAGQTVQANKVTWYQDAVHNETIILADNNGNTGADFEIHLAGLKTLTASDFIL